MYVSTCATLKNVSTERMHLLLVLVCLYVCVGEGGVYLRFLCIFAV